MVTPKNRVIPDGYQSIKTAARLFRASYRDDAGGKLEFSIKNDKLGVFWVDDDLKVEKVKSDFWKRQVSRKVFDMFSSGSFNIPARGRRGGNVQQMLVLKEQLAGLLPTQQTPYEAVKTVFNAISVDQVVAQEPVEKNRGGRPAKYTRFAIFVCSLLFRGDNHKNYLSLLKAAKKEWTKRGEKAVGEDTARHIVQEVFTVLMIENNPLQP